MADPRAIAAQMARRYFSSPRDQQIFLRQMGAEANFQDQTSPAGAQGYAQIMPGTAAAWGVSNPHDPGQAFKAAAAHMAGYLRQYGGSWSKALTAYNAGPGAVGGRLPAETQAYIAKILGSKDVSSGAVSAPPAGLGGLQTTMTPTFDQAGFQTAQRRFALGKLLSGEGQMKDNPLFATGLVTTAAPNPQDFTGTKTVTQPAARPAGSSGGYVNPFGASLVAPGRVDEGVDPTIQGPIRAIGDARVVNISHNFYKGQPYIVYQLTAGPHAGRYVYVSELVTPHVQVGQQVRAGQTIATGHGPIETGWAGGAQGGFMPLANAAQGGSYTEGQATQPGYSFSGLLKRLGANAAR